MRNIHQQRMRAGAIAALVATSVVAYMAVTGAGSAATQAAPVNVDPPTITGTPRVGEVLTAQNGTWDNNPTTFRYRWLRCGEAGTDCVGLLAADGKTYRLVQADVGQTMRVRVTAVNADGAANARSAPTDIVVSSAPLTNTSRPTISGEAPRRAGAHRQRGQLDGQPNGLCFPVAAL